MKDGGYLMGERVDQDRKMVGKWNLEKSGLRNGM
jgi:hypothetical protein